MLAKADDIQKYTDDIIVDGKIKDTCVAITATFENKINKIWMIEQFYNAFKNFAPVKVDFIKFCQKQKLLKK